MLEVKVVKIPTWLLESYDFMILRKHVDPNPTMNPDQVESILSRDPNHRILYKKLYNPDYAMDYVRFY